MGQSNYGSHTRKVLLYAPFFPNLHTKFSRISVPNANFALHKLKHGMNKTSKLKSELLCISIQFCNRVALHPCWVAQLSVNLYLQLVNTVAVTQEGSKKDSCLCHVCSAKLSIYLRFCSTVMYCVIRIFSQIHVFVCYSSVCCSCNACSKCCIVLKAALPLLQLARTDS